MKNRFPRRAIACALLASSSLIGLSATPAQAQMKRPAADEHGIDVISGTPLIPSGKLTIGDPSQGGLEFYRVWQGGGWYHNLSGGISSNGSKFTVTVGPSVETFTLSGGVYQSDDGHGSTLTVSGQLSTYTTSDGTVVNFLNGRLASITKPNGLVITFYDQSQEFCEMEGKTCVGSTHFAYRLGAVTTNTGYMLKFSYAKNNTAGVQPDAFESLWLQMLSVKAINLAVEYCDPNASACTLTQAWPTATISQSTGTPGSFTDAWADALSNTTTAQVASNQLSSIQSPADPSTDFSIGYDSNGRVASFAQGGGTWNYAYSDVGTQRTTTVTQPLGGSKIYVSDIAARELLSVTDELGRTTSTQYDSFARPTRVTQPEGNYTEVTYDGRGNITQTKRVAKSGSGVADIVTTASFDATCSSPKTCNEPNSATDAKGNVTDYTYDSTHGGLLTATQPAPTTGAVRPQVRYGYSALTAYYKNSSGVIVAAPSSIYKLTSVSACQTGSSCAGTSDEVKSAIAYGSAGVANNLLPTSVSSGSGDGSLTATTARAYDMFGNVTSVDGPLSGTADIWGFQYDANRRLTMRISPDPDGAGILKNRAQRLTYNADGNVTKVEAGTTTSLTGAFTAVATGERVESTYDSLGRKVTDALVSGTSTQAALTQYSYDSKGRVTCTAQRMNPAAFSSLPSDACTLGTAGSYGPDRITQKIFDNADEVTQVQVAVGTTDAANERTLTYSNNGQLATLKDGENNLTTYEYDGFDRLSKTRFPLPTKGSNASSTTDYEQLGYDANSNVTSKRLRDATSIAFTFDNLDRVTLKDLPGTEPDVSFGYDNLGRLTSGSQTGNALSFGFDALSRRTSETGPQGTATSTFNLDGTRASLAYPGTGLTVNFDTLVTGEVSKVRENGASSGVGVLATYAYDDEGRRTGVTFGNGVVQSFSYDANSRLASLTNDLSGTSSDLTHSFAYDPASGIASLTRSNNAYAVAKSNVSESGTANGLNQLTAYGGKSLTHDPRGNTTAFGSDIYGYSSENLMKSATVAGTSSTLAYDPLTRLYQTAAGTTSLRFAYDGLDSIAEYDASNALQRRYVFGPGTDEPIVWYEGSGTTNRRFLSSDERGSIISVADSSGVLIGINKYDEYGQPAATNTGAFGYTGQRWLPSQKLWYYKARMYDPVRGRFMQTDPVGYEAGENLYAYVNDDAINATDPSGLCPYIEPGTLICGRQQNHDTSGGSVTNGANSSGSTGTAGDGGPGCPCITPDDPNARASIARWGGYYIGDTWISLRSSFSFASSWGFCESSISCAMGANNANYLGGKIDAAERRSRELQISDGGLTGIGISVPLLAPEIDELLFARQTGLLNGNNFLRIGEGWKGSASEGRLIYRIAIGNKKWPTIRGLPPFPWHLP